MPPTPCCSEKPSRSAFLATSKRRSTRTSRVSPSPSSTVRRLPSGPTRDDQDHQSMMSYEGRCCSPLGQSRRPKHALQASSPKPTQSQTSKWLLLLSGIRLQRTHLAYGREGKARS